MASKSGLKRDKTAMQATAMLNTERNTRWKLAGVVIIALFSFVLYINTYPNGYVMDDVFVTAQNKVVMKGFKGIPEILSTPYVVIDGVSLDYRPCVKITYAIEYELFGENPHISHLIQAFLYASCCAALFFLLVMLLPGYNLLLPLSATLIFAAHPIHTEVVAGLKSRDELLSFLFSIATLYFFVRAITERKFYLYALGFLLFVLAYLSKHSAAAVVVWCPFIVYYTKTCIKLWRPLLVSTCLLLIMAATELAIRTWIIPAEGLARTILFIENPLVLYTDWASRLGMALNSLWFYLGKLTVPYRLGWYYGYNTIPVQKPWEVLPLISLAVHTFLFGFAIKGLRTRNLLSFAIWLYLLAIAPFINIVILLPGIVAERFAFFASVGFCLVLAVALLKVSRTDLHDTRPKLKVGFAGPLLIVLVLYSYKVISRNTDWKDAKTLYEKDMPYLHNSVTANQVYGVVLQSTYQLSDAPAENTDMLAIALKHYQQALEIYPNNAATLDCIGEILAAEYNRPREALPYYERAMQLQPYSAKFHFDLAYCYELIPIYDSALLNYKISIRLDSTYMAAWQNAGVLFSKMGRNDSAIIYNQKLLDSDINSEHGNANQGFFYKKLGNVDKAKYYFEKAIKINPLRRDVAAALDTIEAMSTGVK